METLILQEGEIVKFKITTQLAKGYPQTVGDLFLTNRRLILLPNQLLSIGFGKRWEVGISDIRNIELMKLGQGGSFVGSLGNRIEIIINDNSRHILSTLNDISPFLNALTELGVKKVNTENIIASSSNLQSNNSQQVNANESKSAQDSVISPSTPNPVSSSQNAINQSIPQEQKVTTPPVSPPDPIYQNQMYQSIPPQSDSQPGTKFSSNQSGSFFDKIMYKSAPSNVVCQNPGCKSYNTVNVRKDTLNWGIWLLVVGFPVGLIFFVIPGALAMTAGLFTVAYSFFIPSNIWKCKTCKYRWHS